MNVRSQRGSGILLAIIIVLAISLVAVGMIRFSSRELAGAYAGRKQDALVACAEAGRQLLMSRFRAVGISPTQLSALNVNLDGPAATTRALAGHVDMSPTQVTAQVAQVVAMPAGTLGMPQYMMSDRSNKIMGTGNDLGAGTPYKVIVHCQDHGDGTNANSGRQLEVEFGVRFGL